MANAFSLIGHHLSGKNDAFFPQRKTPGKELTCTILNRIN
jgi:hypothetical protein